MLGAAAAGGMVAGSLLEFFLDPRSGRRRRHTARDRTRARVRRGERRAAVRARRAESHAVGVIRRTISARRRPNEPLDDVTLAQKVERELFRHAQVAKGQISVNAEDGVVFLRGAVDRQEDVDRLGTGAREIDGVRVVENLLHLPGTPAPTSRTKLERRQAGV